MSGEVLPEVFSAEVPEVFDLGGEELEAGELDEMGVEEGVEVEGRAPDSDGYESDPDKLIMDGWINLWGDDQLRKRVLRRGEENTRPDNGYLCNVNMVGCLKDGTTFDDYEPLSIQVGDAEVVLGIDVVLMSMDVGEKSLIEVSPELAYGSLGRVPDVPPNNVLIYLLELISAVPEPDISTYTTEQLRAIGTRKRDRGNWWYTRQEHTVALGCYERALDYLGVNRPEEDELMEDRLKVYNNMAAIHLKMENYAVALEEINYVVAHQPDNVKALFRRGKILKMQGQQTEALEAMSRALELEPDNSTVRVEVNAIVKEMKIESLQAKKLYKKMFGNETAPAATTTPKEQPGTTEPKPKSKPKIKVTEVHVKRKSTKLKSKWGLIAAVAIVAAVAAGLVAYRFKQNQL